MIEGSFTFSDEVIATIKSSPKLMIVTGFGSFGPVEKNPTQDMVEELAQTIKALRQGDQSMHIVFGILEVSTAYCDNFISYVESLVSDEQELIFVHLGVDSQALKIKTEEYAYNNATFRIPDVRGYQPINQSIISALSFDMPCKSCWNIASLAQIVGDICVKDAGQDSLVIPSVDPGRYLCNYIYFRSLFFRTKPGTTSRSLFVHVPPFVQIEKEMQKQVILELLNRLAFDESIRTS